MIFFVCFHKVLQNLEIFWKPGPHWFGRFPISPPLCRMQSSHSTWKFCTVHTALLHKLWQEGETWEIWVHITVWTWDYTWAGRRWRIMQGDLAAAHVEHLQHFPFIGDWVDGDYQHHGEADDDGEGHDGQDDARIRLLRAITPPGKIMWRQKYLNVASWLPRPVTR